MNTPILPHDEALHEFVAAVKQTYRLSLDDELKLLDMVSNMVNIIAVNALARRPEAAPEASPMVPQGVQDGPEFMRALDVSIALGIPLSTLANMRGNARGPAFRKEGKLVLYRRDDVRDWALGLPAPASALPVNGVLRDSLGIVKREDPSEMRS